MRHIRNRFLVFSAVLFSLALLTSSCSFLFPEKTEGPASGVTSLTAFESTDSGSIPVFDPETADPDRIYQAEGTLETLDRYQSGNMLLVLSQSDGTDVTCYIRKDSGIDGMCLTIGEMYAVSGELDEYEGNPELLISSPSDLTLVGGYHFEAVKVVKIIDGDTIRAEDSAGNTVKIRLIGCDCPETEKEGQAGEFYADEATRYTSDTLLGKTVFLEKDHSETDRYGRLLRYVWLQVPEEVTEETIKEYNFSALLVENGYASSLIVGDDDKYEDLLKALEAGAASDGIGMWQKP